MVLTEDDEVIATYLLDRLNPNCLSLIDRSTFSAIENSDGRYDLVELRNLDDADLVQSM